MYHMSNMGKRNLYKAVIYLNRWYHASDSHWTETNEKKVQMAEGYIAFYQLNIPFK